MRPKPLSYKRAIETCLKHQDLIGLPFSPENPEAGNIARIVLAPYNRILQWQFLNNIYSGTDPDTALSICRDGKYEVLLLSSKYKPDSVVNRPVTLCQYIEQRRPPLYATPAETQHLSSLESGARAAPGAA